MENPIEKILCELNPEQAEAIRHGAGPLMIIAGAGTGKTRVITYRIAWLIASGQAKPNEILALTFTEKAAAEMEERVDRLLPYGMTDVWMSTFHSFGDRVLRDYALELGITPDFRVLSRAEQTIFFMENLFEFPLKYYRPLGNPTRHVDAILTLISRAKDEAVTPEEFQNLAVEFQRLAHEHPDAPELAEMAVQRAELAATYAKYQELMSRHGNIDFGDQINLTLQLLREHPFVLKRLQSRFKFILVDEFQDTNYSQFKMVQLLAGDAANINVVCDDDQSIYKFRGAAISNILKFKQDYPQAQQIVLTRNYRSLQPILDTSYRLISNNNPERLEVRDQINKKLIGIPPTDSQPIVQHLHFQSLSAESDAVAEIIEEKVNSGVNQFSDFAILVRANNDADPFLRSLNQRNLPYQFSGSRGLYSQPEVRLLISFLRATTDLNDSISLFHLASSEIYEFEMTELTLCLNSARQLNRSLHHVFSHLAEIPELSGLSADSQLLANKIITNIQDYLDLSRTKPAGAVLYQFLQNSGLLKKLTSEKTPEAEIQILNIAKFFNVVRNYSNLGVDDSLQSFTRHLDLLIEAGDDPATAESDLDLNVVNVLTLHKSKGLEFPVVFMVSLVHNKFPTTRRKDAIELPDELVKDQLPAGDFHIQEERRLFYVGMTRAQRELYLTSARDYGGTRARKVSQFVLEALEKTEADTTFVQPSAIETIEGFAPAAEASVDFPEPIPADQIISLSYFQVSDYLSCPLKYKYIHVLHVPQETHHTLVYGQAIHAAVQEYNRRRALGRPISLDEVLNVFKNRWLNRGFLSREHEEERFRIGLDVLTNFYAAQEKSSSVPTIVEQQFTFMLNYDRLAGRWDRVDETPELIKIIDFKTSEVREQKNADERTKESLQLGIYALAYGEAFRRTPDFLELHFLETGLIGQAKVTEKLLGKARDQVTLAGQGIRARNYTPTPDFMNCRYCPFSGVCPASAA